MSENRRAMPWPVVMVAGYLVPGLAHVLNGERVRGLWVGISVVGLFLLGVLIGGVRVVEFPNGPPGSNLMQQLVGTVVFLPQFFAGPMTFGFGYWAQSLANDPATAGIISHSRSWDIGQIYTAVAGALNLLALIDATARAFGQIESRESESGEASASGGAA